MPERFTRPVLLAGLQRDFEAIRSSSDPSAERAAFLERTKATAARFFRGHEELVAPVLEEMDRRLSTFDASFPIAVSEKLGAAFDGLYRDPEAAERFEEHLRAVEREERERIVESAKGVALSPERMLYGMLDKDDDTVFRIHVAVSQTLPPGQLLGEFRSGMRELARRLKDDPDFANVKEIIGTSWIVGEHPRLARLMGFHVAEEPLTPEEAAHHGGETRTVRKAWMTREELLSTFGK